MALPLLSLASGAFSALGSIAAGNAAKQASELNAFNMETQKINAEMETKAKMNLRLYEYHSNLGVNIGALFATGRDVDVSQPRKTSSVGAFLAENKKIAGKDVNTIAYTGQQKSLAATMAMSAELARGRAAQTSGYITAFSTLTSAVMKYNDVRTGAAPQTPYTSVSASLGP